MTALPHPNSISGIVKPFLMARDRRVFGQSLTYSQRAAEELWPGNTWFHGMPRTWGDRQRAGVDLGNGRVDKLPGERWRGCAEPERRLVASADVD